MRLITYHIKTFGCQMNEYDSERISYILEEEGYKRSHDKESSDIIIINTCAVREKANNRFFGYLGNLKNLKRSEGLPIICITGCTSQQLQQDIIKKFPYIDIALGPRTIHNLVPLIKQRMMKKSTVMDYDLSGFDKDILESKSIDGFRAYIPIIVGCNNFCSYCIVPYVRGREISVPSEQILKKCHDLTNEGVLEITLLGQNVNSYGNDIKSEIDFAGLLGQVSGIEDLKRIRFMTSHPKDFNNDIIDVIASNKNMMKHIHLPLQSGSDKILNLMKRDYDSKSYMDIIHNIKKKIPDCSITTDIIVGFPGEDYQDFKKTIDIVKEVSFSRAFTFIYSKREGTEAESFEDNISKKEKNKWFDELLQLQNSISLKTNSLFINKVFEVLVEGYSAKSSEILEGRMENNLLVNFQGEPSMIGTFQKVLIKDCTPFYLMGELDD